tara:strand:+ start:76 stop:318 length:243 start_codon:yes stop_codon:yes gene_type:complete
MWEQNGLMWTRYDEYGLPLAIIISIEVSEKTSYLGEFDLKLKIKLANYIDYLYTDDLELLKLKIDLILIQHGYRVNIPGI